MSAVFDQAVENARKALARYFDDVRVVARYCDACGAHAVWVRVEFVHENGRPLVNRFTAWRCKEHQDAP
jgi:hypothetical protein